MWAAGGEQRRAETQRVRGDHVVVGQPVDQEQRPRQPSARREQRAGVVRVRPMGGVAEVALGVVRVVEPPLGHRRAGDRGVEHVGAVEHRERGEVATEAPTPDRDPLEVETVEPLGGGVECVDLVVERRGRKVEMDVALPIAAASRRAAAVGDDHGEPLVGEPLRGRERVVRLHDAEGVRAAVRVEQDRQRPAVVVVGEQHGGVESSARRPGSARCSDARAGSRRARRSWRAHRRDGRLWSSPARPTSPNGSRSSARRPLRRGRPARR